MTKKEWQIAIPVLFGLALCVAAWLHGAGIEISLERPGPLRVFSGPQGQRVALVANQALHVLDATGHRLARQELQALGLKESPNDMDWTLDEQQRVQAWFFDDTIPRVIRCNWSEDQRQLTDCATVMSGPQLKVDDRSRAVHLAVDSAGQRVFMADAKGHRVQTFDLSGKLLNRSQPESVPLYFPNRLRYLGADTLVVADNDHRRLAWLQVKPGQAPQLLRALYASDHGQARAGRGKVTDAAFGPDGTIWMLAVKQGQKDGDILVFDHDQRPTVRAALPEGADPLLVDALGDAALVADYSLMNLYRIDAQGRYLGEFGDAALRAELLTLQTRGRVASRWTMGGLLGAGLLIVIGLLLGWKYGQKPAKPGAFDALMQGKLAELRGASTDLRFPVEIEPTPAYRAAARRQAIVVMLMMVVLMLAGWVVMTTLWQKSVSAPAAVELRGAALIGGALMALLLVATGLIWRNMTRLPVLRVTQQQVGWFHGDRPIAQAALQDVYASANALLIGRFQLRFRQSAFNAAKGPLMFDLELLNRAVLARLPTQNLLDDQALLKLTLKNLPGAVKALLFVATAALIGWQIYLSMH